MSSFKQKNGQRERDFKKIKTSPSKRLLSRAIRPTLISRSSGQKPEANLPKPSASSEGCFSSASSHHKDVPCHPLLSYPCCLAPEKCHFGGGKGLNEHLAANICQPTPHILRSISRDQGISDEKPRAHLLLSLFPHSRFSLIQYTHIHSFKTMLNFFQ